MSTLGNATREKIHLIKWSESPQLLNRLIELNERGLSHDDIAKQIFVDRLDGNYSEIINEIPNRNQIKNAIEFARNKAANLSEKVVPDRLPYYSKYRKYIEGDEILEKNSALLSTTLEKSKLTILGLADIHVPFTDETKLQKAIDLNRTADLVVLAGDTMDQYSCSRWRKRKNVPLEVELDGTVRLLEYLSETFPAVVVLPGNHDNRAIKKIHEVVSPELFFLFEEEGPLGLLTRGFNNVWYHPEWYYQVGDTVFTHAERSSSYEGRPAVLTAEFFLVKGWAKRLAMPDIRVVVQAHTHQVSATYREDLKMFECGTLAQVMEYTLDSSAIMRPPLNGCVRIVQNNGVSDFIESREFYL